MTIPLHPLVKRMMSEIPESPPLDDKSMINYHIDNCINPDYEVIGKICSIENIGSISWKHGFDFINMFGAVEALKTALASGDERLIAAVARASIHISSSGGNDVLTESGFEESFKQYTKDITLRFHTRDLCANAYGWINALKNID